MIKLKDILIEKKELGGALINKIERLTDINNHNEARLELAKQMKLNNLVKAYEALMVLHDTFNQMNELMKAREKLDKMLFTGAKRTYSDYDAIEGAF
jgi:adenylosuccinate synthase